MRAGPATDRRLERFYDFDRLEVRQAAIVAVSGSRARAQPVAGSRG